MNPSAPMSARSRRTSRLLVWHVGREFLLPLGCCLGCFVLLFMVIDLFDALSDFVAVRASMLDVAQYFLLRQPEKLVNVLPMSVLLACGYTVSNLMRNQEVTAMRASGISMFHAFLPVWVVAAFCSVLSFFFVEAVAPASSAQAAFLYKQITDPTAPKDDRKWLTSRIRSRDWLLENFSLEGVQHGVQIVQNGPNRRPLWRVVAESAVYVNGHWRLEKVVRIEYAEDGLPKDDIGRSFALLDCPEITESPKEIFGSLRPVSELSIREMRHLLSRGGLTKEARNLYWTQIWYRIAAPFSCVGAALLGIALSLGAPRGGRMRGFAVALVVLVLYYVIGQMMVMFGKNGLLPPFFAGTLPTLLMTGWGLVEMRRRN